MKNKYPKEALELVYERSQLLRKDEEYRLNYKNLKELEKAFRNYDGKDEKEKFELAWKHFNQWGKIKRDWHLEKPINPDFNLKKEDLYKSIRPNSTLAKLIYAFGIDVNSELLKPKERVKTVTERTLERDIQFIKFICFTFVTGHRATYRQFARIFKVDKDTVKKWVEEVKGWSGSKRKAVSSEILTHKYPPDIDVSYLSKHFKTPLSKLEYGSTKNGLYKNGRKLKPKSPDEPEED